MTDQREITAEELESKFKEISVAEFFEKNRHLLGYENPTKALLTIVKEGVDNSLDATNEAGILPEIKITLKQTTPDRFLITVEDNGPGIVESKVPFAFGKLLYGTKFHRLRQSRGTQGIGIHGAVLYSQLTTGRHVTITTSTGKAIHAFEMMINVAKNEPHIVSKKELKNPEKWHGLKIEMEAEGKYIERYQSIPEYLKQTAISNPYAHIIYDGPNGKLEFKRNVNEIPKQPKEIKPHPYGVEIGIMRRMLTNTKAKNIIGFLTTEFSRVGRSSAEQICKLAKIEFNRNPKQMTHEESEKMHKAMQMVKLIAPPTNCLSPLGEHLITEGMKKELQAEYFVAITRPPSVYRGNPFQVEVGLAYGGKLPTDQSAQILRFANKVPLLYHQSDCATNEAIVETDWRRYGFSQSGNAAPAGPLAILTHFASVWVPYTSEGKQAIANYTEIVKEMKLALQEAGRKLAIYVHQKKRLQDRRLRGELFEKYIPELAESLAKLTDKQKAKIIAGLEAVLKKNNVIIQQEEEEEKKNPEKVEENGEKI
jgi:DNA topoisomerase-6 subunit B